MKLRAAPYSREIISARRRGEFINLFIFCGDRCWELAHTRQWATVIPQPQDWRAMDWRSLVGGLPGVTVVGREWPAEALDKLSRHLVLEGAQLVCAISVTKDGELTSIRPQFYRAVVRGKNARAAA